MVTFEDFRNSVYKEGRYYSSVLKEDERNEFLEEIKNTNDSERLYKFLDKISILYCIKNNYSLIQAGDYLWPYAASEYQKQEIKKLLNKNGTA